MPVSATLMILNKDLVKCFQCDFDDIHSFYCNHITDNHNDTNGNNKNTNSFRLICQNIRSYAKNFDEFLVMIEGCKVIFDCIILTEAWLNDESHVIQLPGYNMFRTYNNMNMSDGLVVYLSDQLRRVTCRELRLGGAATSLLLTCHWDDVPCEILATYRSPSSNFSLFVDGLKDYCTQNYDSKVVKIVAGDINCDIMKNDPSDLENSYIDTLYEANYLACIDKVTRPSSNSCLDHIFLKLPNKIYAQSLVIDSAITDHCAISLQLLRVNSSPNKNTKHFYVKTDWNKIEDILAQTQWNNVVQNSEVNSSTNEFIEVIKRTITQYSEQKERNAKTAKLKPWITNGLVLSIRRRDKMRKIVLKQPYNVNLRNEYLKYRNTLGLAIRRAKTDYYKDKIAETKNDVRKFWSIVNEVAGRLQGKQPFPVDSFVAQGSTVTPTQIKSIANDINKYFASVGPTLAGNLHPTGQPEVDDEADAREAVFNMRPITRAELFETVKSLRGCSAPGWDSIPTKFIKDNIRIFTEPLLHIINLSIRTGKFPDAFKIAKVIPIYKSGDKADFSNYRPISLLPVFGKILEKVVKKQFIHFLEQGNIIMNEQFGFRQNMNTSDALLKIIKLITNEISNNRKVLITFLDLAKAFDCVNRSKLLSKLNSIGVRNTSLEWFVSYFDQRMQTVTINGVESDPEEVPFGVIQGSTLGPLLFLIYVNNISRVCLKGQLLLFADDTALISAGGTWEEAFEQASSDLVKIKNWFDHNCLTINVGKTKCLPIFLRSDVDLGARALRLHSCGAPGSGTCACDIIERVVIFKYLGVIIDHKLCWAPHVQYVKQRLIQLIYAFRQLTQVLSVDCCRGVYFAYVQSVLMYGILAWGGASANVLEPVSVTQRAIIKHILKKPPRYPTQLVFSDFGVFTVRQLFIKSLIFYIRCNKDSLFTEIQHTYDTRSRSQYGYEIPRLTYSVETVNAAYMVHIVHRNLPQELAMIEGDSAAKYKRRVVGWLRLHGPDAAEALLRSPYT